jgi:hypothetical protein
MKQAVQILISAAATFFFGPVGTTWAMAFKQAIVMTAVTTAASYLFRPKLGSSFGIDNRNRMVRQALTSRKIVYGYQRVSGPIVFITSTNNNKFLHLVIALADHEIQDYGSFFINEDEVAINPSTGFVTSTAYIKNGNPLVRIKTYLGTDAQTADSDLVSEVTEWTTDHRLRGVAYIYVRLEFDSQVFQDGIPNLSAAIRGKKVFDYRTSTTAYSFNPALVLADYLRSARHGLNADATEINAASFIVAANICDENVNLAYTPSARAQTYLGISQSGSTWRERRYQTHGVVDTEKNPGEVIEELLSSMGGTLAYIGGQWTVKAAAYSSPAITLTVDDLRGPITTQTKVPRNESFNAVKGVFINPDANWQATDYPAITSATFKTEDNNQTNFVDLNLPYTVSSSMAQRLAKIALFRNRQEITLSMPCKLKAFNLKPGDTVNVTIDRYGFTNKVFEVADWKLAFSENDVGVDLQLRELNAAVFDWNADERLFNEDNTTLPNSFAPPPALTNVTFSSVARINADGTVVPVNTLTWTQSPNIFVLSGGYIEVQVKVSSSSNWTSLDRIQGDGVEIVVEGGQPGASIDVQVRAVNINNIPSDWVTLLNRTIAGDSTAPAAPSGLTATGAQRTVQLAWTNPTVADYFTTDIFRNTTNNSGTAVLIGTISGSTYADSGLAAATTFFYWVKARDFSGNVSGFSNGASATTDAAAISAATTPRTASGVIYYTLASATAPTAPTASNFNFSTNSFGSLTANWTTTFTAPTSTQSKFWAVNYLVQEATRDGSQTITISGVFNHQNFDGIATFTNLAGKIDNGGAATDVNNNVTTISGGKITTNTLSASVIQSNTTKTANNTAFGLGTGQQLGGLPCGGQFTSSDANTWGLIVANTAAGYGLAAGSTVTSGGASAFQAVGYANNALSTFRFLAELGASNLAGRFRTGGTNNVQTAVTADLLCAHYDGTTSWAAYVQAGTIGPFTGAHDGIMSNEDDEPEVGDILVDYSLVAAPNVSDSITIVKVSTSANQKAAIGVYVSKCGSKHIPASLCEYIPEAGPSGSKLVFKPEFENLLETHYLVSVNAIGEGKINVCGEGGDIEAGDLIVTSSIPGKGMKQSDDIVRAITVAKARESVQFSGNEIKQIACIYLCG